MANRTVSVELLLETSRYKAAADEAAARTEQLKTSAEKADRQVDQLGRDSVKTSAELKALGLEADAARLKLNDVGHGASTSLELVDQRLVETRAKVKELAEEFNRTGSVDSFNLWKQATKDTQSLERLKKDLSNALGIVAQDGGQAVAKGVADGTQQGLQMFGKTFSSLPPEAQAAIGGGIAAAILASSTFIGAALGGAILAGSGLGGIAVGIVGQIHDPAVVTALSQLKSSVMVALTDATSAFGPALAAAADTGRDGLVKFLAAIKPGLDALAPALDKLVAGLTTGLIRAAPEFVKAFQAAAEILGQFADDLPGLIHAFGDFFSMLADGTAGAKDGLHDLLVLIEALVETTGFALRGLEESFHALGLTFHVLHDVFTLNINDLYLMGSAGNVAAGAGDKVRAVTEGVAASVTNAGMSAGEAATAFQNLAKGLDAVFNRTMNVNQATLQWQQSILALKDSVQQNGTSLDGMTKAGNANLQQINQSIQSINQLRDANIANGMSIDEANGKYQAQLNQLQTQLIQMGFNKQAVQALIDQYRQIPTQVSTTVNVLGLDAGIYKLDSVKTKLDDLNGKVTTTYVVVNTETGQTQKETRSRGYNRWGGIYEHAETGLLNAGIYSPTSPARYAFAEPATGGEAFVPRLGDYGRSTAILDQAARWYGGRFMPGGAGGGAVRVELAFTGAAAGSLGSVIMGMVRTGEIQIKTSQLVPG